MLLSLVRGGEVVAPPFRLRLRLGIQVCRRGPTCVTKISGKRPSCTLPEKHDRGFSYFAFLREGIQVEARPRCCSPACLMHYRNSNGIPSSYSARIPQVND